MPRLKLTYFDFHGGRGEPARIALTMANVPFEDDRIPYSRWSELKGATPFGSLPVLEHDGRRLAQSNAINRFVGKLTNLYPTDPWQAAVCDEVMDAVEDVSQAIVASFSIRDEEEKKAVRKQLAEGPISRYLAALQARLLENGGEFFADGRLTMADLKVFLWVRHLRSGNLDHVPVDLSDRVAPELVKHFERVSAHAGVAAYYATRKAP